MNVSDGLLVIHEFDGAVLAAQIGLVVERLKADDIDPASVDVRQMAGEAIRRDLLAQLADRGVQFDGGTMFSLAGGFLSMSFQLGHDRDLLMVKSFVENWMPS